MRVFFSVGEPSGDLHGANLIRALQQQSPGIQCLGFGGPRMADAGCELLADLTELAVMWFLRAIVNLPRFWALYRQASRSFRTQPPEAVVLIDYPGFNWWIARAAKRRGIPVYYYGVPQMWAWAPWRVRKMKRLVDHALCKLPFEAQWFRQRGCPATFVGHPYFDQLAGQALDAAFLQDYARQPGPLVAILPGSRTQEVVKNLPRFLETAGLIQRRIPETRFAIACFNDRQAQIAGQLLTEYVLQADILVGRTAELIHLSRCCLACSGSVSLELLFYTKPSLILYWTERWPLAIATRFFMKVKFISLVNLLGSDNPFLGPGERYDPLAARADDVPLPEYLTCEDPAREMADRIVAWIKDEACYRQRVARLSDLKKRYASTGASNTAAQYLLGSLPSPATLAAHRPETESTAGADTKADQPLPRRLSA